MIDPPVSVTTASATVLWINAFVLATIYTFQGVRGTGVFAILFAAGAATLTVRGYLITLADDLREREMNAFQIGMDAQQIKPLR